MSVTLSRVKCQSCDKVLPVTPWSRIQLLEASSFSSPLEEDVGGLFIKVRWRSWGGDRKTVVTLRTAWHCTLSCTGGLVNDAYMIFFIYKLQKRAKGANGLWIYPDMTTIFVLDILKLSNSPL